MKNWICSILASAALAIIVMGIVFAAFNERDYAIVSFGVGLVYAYSLIVATTLYRKWK